MRRLACAAWIATGRAGVMCADAIIAALPRLRAPPSRQPSGTQPRSPMVLRALMSSRERRPPISFAGSTRGQKGCVRNCWMALAGGALAALWRTALTACDQVVCRDMFHWHDHAMIQFGCRAGRLQARRERESSKNTRTRTQTRFVKCSRNENLTNFSLLKRKAVLFEWTDPTRPHPLQNGEHPRDPGSAEEQCRPPPRILQ